MRASLGISAGLSLLTAVTLVGCTAPAQPTTGTEHATTGISHVHAAVVDRATSGFLLGTHDGVYPVSDEGAVGVRLGPAFDVMGLAAWDKVLIASGHPSASTPAAWGSPNLGVIQSTSGAREWDVLAFQGEKDFHALAFAPDGLALGLPTDTRDLLSSSDGGHSWAPTGAQLDAWMLTVDATGRILATTRDGLEASTDGGTSFEVIDGAPMLSHVAASPSGNLLAGVDSRERLWTSSAGGTEWVNVGSAHGSVQALTVTDDGTILMIDDSGISVLPPSVRGGSE